MLKNVKAKRAKTKTFDLKGDQWIWVKKDKKGKKVKSFGF
jgi:hypothetical protein